MRGRKPRTTAVEDLSSGGNELNMSEDEKSGYGLAALLGLLTAVPLTLAILFICCRAASKETWPYYTAFFLIGIAPRLFSILLKFLFGSESELHGGTGSGISLGPLFYGVLFYFPLELFFFYALSLYLEKLPNYNFHLGREAIVFFFLLVLVQAGMRILQDAVDVPLQFRRLHRAVYNRGGWFPYSLDVLASTYSMPRGGKYQEVGIVLIERRKKERYKSEEFYLSGRSGFLFAPLFLVRSSSAIRPPAIRYDAQQYMHEGPITVQFMGDGAALVKHHYAVRSFNIDKYRFRPGKFLQLPSGFRKRFPPSLTFSGRCPVLVPKK